MAHQLDVFDDFHLHGASAPEWNQRYLQISPGTMRSSLTQVTTDGLHVFRKWMSGRVVQQGCVPEGKVCFAIPLDGLAGTPRMQGREVREDTVFLLRSAEEFTLQRPQGMELMAVTFALEDFRRLLDERAGMPDAASLLSRPVLHGPGRSIRRLRHELLSLFDAPSSTPGPASRAVFEALCELFIGAATTRQAVGSASASAIVAQCHRLVAASGPATPSIEALCVRLRTSRRSLQNSFRQVADSTPVHYLRSVRLNAVRRRLLSTRAADLSIAQAATDHGFDHLGHFTQRYKALFGELPSQTARARFADSG